MAHQRLLKSEYFTDYDVAQMPPLYRLFFQGLWCQADKNGVLVDKPQQLKVRVMPYDDVDPEAVIDELVRREFIIRYKVGEERLLAIRTWAKNQAVNKNEKGSNLPGPDKATETYVARIPPAQVSNSCTTAGGQLSSLPVPFPSPSPVPSPVPNPGAVSQLPNSGLLRERLEAGFQKITGSRMKWDTAHERDLVAVIAEGEAEIVRRWLIALETPYPRCSSVRDLVGNWNDYARPAPTNSKKPDPRKDPIRAEDMKHPDQVGPLEF